MKGTEYESFSSSYRVSDRCRDLCRIRLLVLKTDAMLAEVNEILGESGENFLDCTCNHSRNVVE